MREKAMRLIVTFHTTSAAMAMEKYCKEENLPGRLIPVRREITSGCGMSWMADPKDKSVLEETVKKHDIQVEGYFEIMF